MRHNKKFNHLGRKKAHRDALLSNMTISLIMHKRINTTLAKAKALPSTSGRQCRDVLHRACGFQRGNAEIQRGEEEYPYPSLPL